MSHLPRITTGMVALIKAHSERAAGQANATAYATGAAAVVHVLQESLAVLQKAQGIHPPPSKPQ